MEKAFYEMRPVLYVIAAVWAYIKMGDSHLAAISAVTLLFSGVIILQRRYEYRKASLK
ncbi:hypothetical protein D3C87_1722100 [compost metagenome]